MKTSRCKLLITAFIVSALLIAGLSIGLAENTRPEFEGELPLALTSIRSSPGTRALTFPPLPVWIPLV